MIPTRYTPPYVAVRDYCMAAQRVGTNKARPLNILGINEAEERVYRCLLDQPGASATEVAKALPLPQSKVQHLLDIIESKGLATHRRRQPHCYTPISPDIALNALMLSRQEELKRAEGAILELQERATRCRKAESTPMIELIEGRKALRQVYDQIHRTAEHEILTLQRPPVLVSRMDVPVEQDNYEQIRSKARGTRYRTVVDKEFLTLPFAISRIRQDQHLGEEVKVVPRLPFKAVLSDSSLAIIPLDFLRAEGPVLLVRQGVLLDALHALFEFYWGKASPILLTGTNDFSLLETAGRVPDEDKEILSLLATGMNDKSIIYELGISRSTYSRRISELMDLLSAGSRFQLGWLAKEYMSGQSSK